MKNLLKHKVKQLPPEGSIFTITSKNAYEGMTGVVKHHDCKTRFMIYTGKSFVCNIKP